MLSDSEASRVTLLDMASVDASLSLSMTREGDASLSLSMTCQGMLMPPGMVYMASLR